MRSVLFRGKSVGLLTVFVLLVSGLAVVTSVVGVPLAQATGNVPMDRLYYPGTGEHFYTGSLSEAVSNVNSRGWVAEGVGWYAPPSGTGSPVYRLAAKAGTGSAGHLYTTSAAERSAALGSGAWTDEGVGWYSSGSVPVYREYFPATGQHNFTADANEHAVLTSQQGWKSEGIGWYGVSGAVPGDQTVNNGIGLIGNQLPLTAVVQGQNNWCWAASTQMIQTQVRKTTTAQCVIVMNTLGLTTCPDSTASDDQVRRSLNVVGLSYSVTVPSLPNPWIIKSQVDIGVPLDYLYRYPAPPPYAYSGSHNVVIIGYVLNQSNLGASTIYWNDPLGGRRKSQSWSYLSLNDSWFAGFTVYGIS